LVVIRDAAFFVEGQVQSQRARVSASEGGGATRSFLAERGPDAADAAFMKDDGTFPQVYVQLIGSLRIWNALPI
jgi:hypothetical protein